MTGDAEVIQLAAFRGKPGKSALRARRVPETGKFHPVQVVVSDEPETTREQRRRERRERQAQTETARNMHTFAFRSYGMIVEADNAHLVRDVCCDIDKAQTKLKAIRRRLKGAQEQAAAQIAMLTTADTKLTAAIAAALLSRGTRADPPRQKRDHVEENRKWKAAFRERVTRYAEQHGIDKGELAWLGRIKHYDIAAFAERHRLSYHWLLEGEGPEGRQT
jgi:hypothetical protein